MYTYSKGGQLFADRYNKQITDMYSAVWHNLASGDTNRQEQRVGQ